VDHVTLHQRSKCLKAIISHTFPTCGDGQRGEELGGYMIAIFRDGRSLSKRGVYVRRLTEAIGARGGGPFILMRRLLAK
jgi:hypothetical protein